MDFYAEGIREYPHNYSLEKLQQYIQEETILESRAPVSYTHLDVYKRQGVDIVSQKKDLRTWVMSIPLPVQWLSLIHI